MSVLLVTTAVAMASVAQRGGSINAKQIQYTVLLAVGLGGVSAFSLQLSNKGYIRSVRRVVHMTMLCVVCPRL
jgi:hypothetical protein